MQKNNYSSLVNTDTLEKQKLPIATDLFLGHKELNEIYKNDRFHKFVFQPYLLNPSEAKQPFRLVCYAVDKENRQLTDKPIFIKNARVGTAIEWSGAAIFGNLELTRDDIKKHYEPDANESIPAAVNIVLRPFLKEGYLIYQVVLEGGEREYKPLALNPCPPAIPGKFAPNMLNVENGKGH